MNREQLFQEIKRKRSFLCIGLDSDIQKIPVCLKSSADPIFEFNRQIIDATAEFCVAFKPNLAFYESQGAAGWMAFENTVGYLRRNYPEQFIIADAKRGDIGNTSGLYARAFFENLDVDAVTVAPYMGEDSVRPFLTNPGKWVILLALTSNPGATDFQFIRNDSTGEFLYETILKKSQNWGNAGNMMYVVGATKAEKLVGIREIVPEHFLLVPGVGAQGGSLGEVARYGMNSQCGLLVNSSRNIIFASPEDNFAEKAHLEAKSIRDEMDKLLEIKQL